jgi:hypothetical protein
MSTTSGVRYQDTRYRHCIGRPKTKTPRLDRRGAPKIGTHTLHPILQGHYRRTFKKSRIGQAPFGTFFRSTEAGSHSRLEDCRLPVRCATRVCRRGFGILVVAAVTFPKLARCGSRAHVNNLTEIIFLENDGPIRTIVCAKCCRTYS